MKIKFKYTNSENVIRTKKSKHIPVKGGKVQLLIDPDIRTFHVDHVVVNYEDKVAIVYIHESTN